MFRAPADQPGMMGQDNAMYSTHNYGYPQPESSARWPPAPPQYFEPQQQYQHPQAQQYPQYPQMQPPHQPQPQIRPLRQASPQVPSTPVSATTTPPPQPPYPPTHSLPPPPPPQPQPHLSMQHASSKDESAAKRLKSSDTSSVHSTSGSSSSSRCMEQPLPTLSTVGVVDFSALQFSAQALREPIVIMRNMLGHPQVNFDNRIFQYDSLDKSHLSQGVNVLHQAVDPCGWNLRGQYWMKQGLTQYVAHMKRVNHQICAFRDAIGLEQKCSSEPRSAVPDDPERSDLRTFLVLSQNRPRVVPKALQTVNVGWPDMTAADFQKVNKKEKKAFAALYRRMNAFLEQLPIVKSLRQAANGRPVNMVLGSKPYRVAAEPCTIEDETFLLVYVGASVVLLYGPLKCEPDGSLPFDPAQLTVDQMIEELTYIWKHTYNFLTVDHSEKEKRLRQFDDMAQFCSNLDIGHWTEEVRALSRRLPSWLWCNSPYDILGLLRQPVAGMNVPQLYVKAPGSWTGGHEENCRFRSVNCNHGPGCSEWFAVEAAYAPVLRERVLNDHRVDIYAAEGNWFPDPKWLDDYGIPYMVGIQRPGDVVILKGETLHWVRSLGCASHSSWNFGLLDTEQLEHAMERYTINESITPPMQSLVPMKMLIIDICRFFLHSNGLLKGPPSWNPDTLRLRLHREPEHLRIRVLTWLLLHVVDVIVEDKLWREHATQQFGSPSVDEPPGALVVYCQHPGCVREITTAYFRCDGCGAPASPSKKQATEKIQFMCLQCGILHASQTRHHELHFLHKDSIDNLMQDLQQMMVFVSRNVSQTPSLFAQRSEQAVFRVSADIQKFQAGKPPAAEPASPPSPPPPPPPVGKKRGRPKKQRSQQEDSSLQLPLLSSEPSSVGDTASDAPHPPLERARTRSAVQSEAATNTHATATATAPAAARFADHDVLKYLTQVADSSVVGTLALLNALNLDPRYLEKRELLQEAASTAMRLRTLLSQL